MRRYNIAEEKIYDLTELMRFDNYQKTSSMNKKQSSRVRGKDSSSGKELLGIGSIISRTKQFESGT